MIRVEWNKEIEYNLQAIMHKSKFHMQEKYRNAAAAFCLLQRLPFQPGTKLDNR